MSKNIICKVKKYRLCPSLFFSIMCLFIGLAIAILFMCYFCLLDVKRGTSLSGDFTGLLIVCFGTAMIIFTSIRNSFEYFGTMEIHPFGLIFRAPFRKRIVFQFDNLADVGIDYGHISGEKQFWIYFSLSKIPVEYWHKINRLPFSTSCMRIQYSQEVMNDLLLYMPDKKTKKQLVDGQSTLRVNKSHG